MSDPARLTADNERRLWALFDLARRRVIRDGPLGGELVLRVKIEKGGRLSSDARVVIERGERVSLDVAVPAE